MHLASPLSAAIPSRRQKERAPQLRVGEVPVECGGALASCLPWSLRAVSMAGVVPPVERRGSPRPA